MPTDLPTPNVIYYERGVIVLNKPGGLLTQAPPGIDSLERQVKSWIKKNESKEGKVYVGVPHRLDRPVSGVIVMARNVRVAQRLSSQFESRTIKKTYWAIVEGVPEKPEAKLRDFMRKIPGEARSECCGEGEEGAKEAILNYHVLDRGLDKALLEIDLETGRTHQIRLQLSAHGFPIVGDEMYQSKSVFGPDTLDTRKRWIALHARQIQFEHPVLHVPLSKVAPLSDYWKAFESELASLKMEYFETGSSDPPAPSTGEERHPNS